MKKTLIALLALSSLSMAFEDATWTFENLNTPTTTITEEITCDNINTDKISYVDSGLTQGTTFGEYALTQDLDKAVAFTQDDARIKITSSYWSSGAGVLNLSQDFTFMTWVKVASTSGEHFLFATGSDNKKGLGFDLQDGGTLTLTRKSKEHITFTNAIVTADEWTNIAITYSSADKKATAYINGVEKGAITLSDTAVNAADGYATINSNGANNNAGSKVAQYAEMKILSGALSQAEILQAAHLTPEPATATLSLLALAGLASRRRRH